MRSRCTALRHCLAVMIWALVLAVETMVSAETDRTRDGLLGPVRHMTTIVGKSTTMRTYDREGMLLESISQGHPKRVLIYKNGSLQSTIDYRYDDQGRLDEQVEVMPDATQGSKTTYGYDERGRLVAETLINRVDSSLNAKSTYEHDDRGNWTKKTTRRIGILEEDLSIDNPLEVTERTIDYF